jgi:hypothetical protein
MVVNLDLCDKTSDLTFEAVDTNCSGTSCGEEEIGDGVLSIWEGHKYLQSIDLYGCWGITDMVISALGHGCGQLHTVILSYCQGITEFGVSALSHGCGQLQTMDVSGCGSSQTSAYQHWLIEVVNCRRSFSVIVKASQS